MKPYIDKQLLQLERAITYFSNWCSECHDDNMLLDCRCFALAVEYCKEIVRVYYKHWTNEFTIPMYQRMARLLSFDTWRMYSDYMAKYSVRTVYKSKESNDDLPF